MKFLLLKLGHIKSVIVITLFSVLSSILITYLIMRFADMNEVMGIGLLISTIVPLIVAPPVTITLNNLLFQTFKLETEMRTLASTDYLTQLLSRREWIDQATRYMNLADRSSNQISILMIDLDNFKGINDNFGHLIGDKALVLFAESIRASCRSSDISGRFGGEEFIILLPNTPEQQALQFSERLHYRTRLLEIESGGDIVTLTASIGVSIYSQETPFNLDTLISHADNALYQAKDQGKNCTVVYPLTDKQS